MGTLDLTARIASVGIKFDLGLGLFKLDVRFKREGYIFDCQPSFEPLLFIMGLDVENVARRCAHGCIEIVRLHDDRQSLGVSFCKQRRVGVEERAVCFQMNRSAGLKHLSV